jgi:hypothetical protein
MMKKTMREKEMMNWQGLHKIRQRKIIINQTKEKIQLLLLHLNKINRNK